MVAGIPAKLLPLGALGWSLRKRCPRVVSAARAWVAPLTRKARMVHGLLRLPFRLGEKRRQAPGLEFAR